MVEARAPLNLKDWAVGSEVSVETTLGEILDGQVFAFDPDTNCVILKDSGTTPTQHNLRLLKADFIKAVLSAAAPTEVQDLRLPQVNLVRCKEREDKAIQAAEQEAAKIGVGVTPEAQQIFDALSKTMPCRWDKHMIIVLGEVRVKEPYKLADVNAVHGSSTAACQRVKKVLEAERSRLGLGM